MRTATDRKNILLPSLPDTPETLEIVKKAAAALTEPMDMENKDLLKIGAAGKR